MQDAGDSGAAFTSSIGTATAVKVYTQNYADREVFFQNTDTTYNVACSTWSAFSSSSGPRFYLPKNFVGVTTNGTYSIWCLAESGAGSGTVEVVGIRERSSKDLP